MANTTSLVKEYLAATNNLQKAITIKELNNLFIKYGIPSNARAAFTDFLTNAVYNESIDYTQKLITTRLNRILASLEENVRITSLIERARRRNTINLLIYKMIDFEQFELSKRNERLLKKRLSSYKFSEGVMNDILGNVNYYLGSAQNKLNKEIKKDDNKTTIKRKRAEIKRVLKSNIKRANENSIKKDIAEEISTKSKGKKALWLPSDSKPQAARESHQAYYGRVFDIGFILKEQSRPNCKCSFVVQGG